MGSTFRYFGIFQPQSNWLFKNFTYDSSDQFASDTKTFEKEFRWTARTTYVFLYSRAHASGNIQFLLYERIHLESHVSFPWNKLYNPYRMDDLFL